MQLTSTTIREGYTVRNEHAGILVPAADWLWRPRGRSDELCCLGHWLVTLKKLSSRPTGHGVWRRGV